MHWFVLVLRLPWDLARWAYLRLHVAYLNRRLVVTKRRLAVEERRISSEISMGERKITVPEKWRQL